MSNQGARPMLPKPDRQKAIAALDALLAQTITLSSNGGAGLLPPSSIDVRHLSPAVVPTYAHSGSGALEKTPSKSPLEDVTTPTANQSNIHDDQHLYEILQLQQHHHRQQELNRQLLEQQNKLFQEQQQHLLEEQKQHKERLQRQYNKLTQDQQDQQRHQSQHGDTEEAHKSNVFVEKRPKKECSPDQHRQRLSSSQALVATASLVTSSIISAASATTATGASTLGDSTDSEPSLYMFHRRYSTTTQDEAFAATPVKADRRKSQTPKRRYKKTIMRQQAADLAAQIKIENESRDREAARRVIAREGLLKHQRSLRSWLSYAQFKAHHGWEEQPLHMVTELFEEELEEQSADSDEFECHPYQRGPSSFMASPSVMDYGDADDENDTEDRHRIPGVVVHELDSTESESDDVHATPCKPRGFSHIANAARPAPGSLPFKALDLRKPAPLFSRMPVPMPKANLNRQLKESNILLLSESEEELVPWTPRMPAKDLKPSAQDLLPTRPGPTPMTQQELFIQQQRQLQDLQKRQLEQLQELQKMQQAQQLELQQAHNAMALKAAVSSSSQEANSRHSEEISKSRTTSSKKNLTPISRPPATPPPKQIQQALALQQRQRVQQPQPLPESIRKTPTRSLSASVSPSPQRTPTKSSKMGFQLPLSRDYDDFWQPSSPIKPQSSKTSKPSMLRESSVSSQIYASEEESEHRQPIKKSDSQHNSALRLDSPRVALQKQQKLLQENLTKERQLKEQQEHQLRVLEERQSRLAALKAQHAVELANNKHERELVEEERERKGQKGQLAKETKRSQMSSSSTSSVSNHSRPPFATVPTLPNNTHGSLSSPAKTASIVLTTPSATIMTPKKKKTLNPVQKAPSTENILATVRTSTAMTASLAFAKSALLGNKRVLSLADDKENTKPAVQSHNQNDGLQSSQTTSWQHKESFTSKGHKRQRQKSASPVRAPTPEPAVSLASCPADLPSLPQTMADHRPETPVPTSSEILSSSAVNSPTLLDSDSAAFTAALLEASSPCVTLNETTTLSTAVPSQPNSSTAFMQYFDQWMSDMGNDESTDFTLPVNQDTVAYDYSVLDDSATPSMAKVAQAGSLEISDEAYNYQSGPENDGTDVEGSELDRLLYTGIGDSYGFYGTPQSTSDLLSSSGAIQDLMSSDAAGGAGSDVYEWLPDVNNGDVFSGSFADQPATAALLSSDAGTMVGSSLSPAGHGQRGSAADLVYEMSPDAGWLQHEMQFQQPDYSSSRAGTPNLDSTASSSLFSSTLSDMMVIGNGHGAMQESPRAKHYQPMGFGGQPMMATPPTKTVNSPLSMRHLFNAAKSPAVIGQVNEDYNDQTRNKQQEECYEIPDPNLYAAFVN
ncbi:hypothetical protein BG004_002219 [Podila humilis]|nr:hypothetical protein BG004_002219 [Podila humilis]